MSKIQKILVSVLSLLFVFCVPLHIYDATTNIDHHAMSHSKDACALTIIDEQFAHFHEMTSALLATLLILAWSVVALWYQHQSRNLHTATLSWVPIEFFETYLSHKKGILYWLKLQTISPPFFLEPIHKPHLLRCLRRSNIHRILNHLQ